MSFTAEQGFEARSSLLNLDEGGIKTDGRIINSLRYSDDAILLPEKVVKTENAY